MKKIIYIAVPIMMLTLYGCSHKKNTTDSETKNEIKIVKVFTAQKTSFTRTRTISAETSAFRDITLSAEANGKVEWLKLSEGDPVFRGQLLAKIDEQMAKAQYDVASANYSLANSNYDRQSQLYEKKIISDMQYDQSRTQLQTAKAALELAAIQLKNTSIYSPIRGIVAAKFINENELINVGRPIIRVVNLDSLKITVEVVEQDMTNLQLNQTVQVIVPSLGPEMYTGTINKIGSVADAKNKTFPIEILLANPARKIKVGMVCSVTFNLNRIDNAIIIPQDLILEGENSKSLMIVSGNTAVMKPVDISQPEKGRVAIIKGVEAGEKIIFQGNKSVGNGDKVQMIEEPLHENN